MYTREFHLQLLLLVFFLFNDPAPAEIYTLSLHDALPICRAGRDGRARSARRRAPPAPATVPRPRRAPRRDRKSTRLNSSHMSISYAVFCLKKKTDDIRDADGVSQTKRGEGLRAATTEDDP